MQTERWSPDWVVERLESVRQSAVRRAASALRDRSGGALALIMIGLVTALSGMLFHRGLGDLRQLRLALPLWVAYMIFFQIPLMAGAMVAAALLAPLRRFLGGAMVPLALAGMMVIGSALFPRGADLASLSIGALILFSIHFVSVLVLRRCSLPVRMAGAVLATVLVGLVTSLVRLHGNFLGFREGLWLANQILFIWRLTVVLAEDAVGIAAFPLFSRRFFEYYLLPSNFSLPLPISTQDFHPAEDRTATVLQGALDCMVGFGALAAVWWVRRRLLPLANPKDAGWLHYGTGMYLIYYLSSWAKGRFASGTARYLGYATPDQFHYPLLSANPMERWRRWNHAIFEWLRSYAFFPVFRKSGSLFLAVFAAFMASGLIHLGVTLSLLMVYPASSLDLGYFWGQLLRFFPAHAAVIFLYLKTQSLWPVGSTRAGWWGVLATHLLMIVVHVFG